MTVQGDRRRAVNREIEDGAALPGSSFFVFTGGASRAGACPHWHESVPCGRGYWHSAYWIEREAGVKKALIVWGGWDGHEPKQVAEILEGFLSKNGFDVEVSDTLDAFLDEEKLKRLDLIVPEWTMGTIKKEQLQPLLAAVKSGVGLGGVHGGMGDSFRNECEYQWMVGGQWVAHPGNDTITYEVNIIDHDHEITKGLKDFKVTSEQYYMHVDPSNYVLATTTFQPSDILAVPCVMPVAWTRHYGKGRVYYCSLGHVAKTAREPGPLGLITRGLLWASKKD